jgi:hypothetical protein
MLFFWLDVTLQLFDWRHPFAVDRHHEVTLPIYEKSVGWHADRRRDPTPINTQGPARQILGALDINGPVKVAGTGSEACTPATYGAIRYNAAGNYFELCSP